MIAAFRRDWELGIPLVEMAAMYEFRNPNSVTRVAQRLGLKKRPGGPTPNGLSNGRWVNGPRSTLIWEGPIE